MHRRARHLNVRDAGAVLVLDSRFITGLNDNAAVATWNDRSRNGSNATQATVGKQPTYRTSIQGGQPALQFTSANQQWIGGNTTINTTTTTCVTLFTMNSSSRAYARILAIADSISPDYNSAQSTTFHCRDNVSSQLNIWRGGSPRLTSVTIALATPTLASTVFNGSTCAFRLAGTQRASVASTGNFNANTYRCGWSINVNDYGDYLDGYQFCNYLFNSAPDVSLLRRIEHSAALAFKIACS